MGFNTSKGYIPTTAQEEKAILGKVNAHFDSPAKQLALSVYRWQKRLANVLLFQSLTLGGLQEIHAVLLRDCPDHADYLKFIDYTDLGGEHS